MLTLKPIQRLLVAVDPEVRQRRPQNRCWRSSTSDADHSWQLSLQPTWQVTSVIQAALKNKPKKPSMYFHFEMTWRCFSVETNIFARGFLLKTLIQMPDFGAHAESVKFHLQRVWSQLQTQEPWGFLSYFKNLLQLFLINLHFFRIRPLCLKWMHIGQRVLTWQI